MTRVWLALAIVIACTNACSMGRSPDPTPSATLDQRSLQLWEDTRHEPDRFLARAGELGMLVDDRGVIFDLLLQEGSREAAVAAELRQLNIGVRDISERYHRATVYVQTPQALHGLTTAKHVRRVDATRAPILRQVAP